MGTNSLGQVGSGSLGRLGKISIFYPSDLSHSACVYIL